MWRNLGFLVSCVAQPQLSWLSHIQIAKSAYHVISAYHQIRSYVELNKSSIFNFHRLLRIIFITLQIYKNQIIKSQTHNEKPQLIFFKCKNTKNLTYQGLLLVLFSIYIVRPPEKHISNFVFSSKLKI